MSKIPLQLALTCFDILYPRDERSLAEAYDAFFRLYGNLIAKDDPMSRLTCVHDVIGLILDSDDTDDGRTDVSRHTPFTRLLVVARAQEMLGKSHAIRDEILAHGMRTGGIRNSQLMLILRMKQGKI